MIIPDTRQRLEAAYEDLQAMLVRRQMPEPVCTHTAYERDTYPTAQLHQCLACPVCRQTPTRSSCTAQRAQMLNKSSVSMRQQLRAADIQLTACETAAKQESCYQRSAPRAAAQLCI